MNKTTFAAFGALVTWFGIIAQYYLMIENRQFPVMEATLRFFSYFTILTNLMVALFFTSHLLGNNSKLKKFFQRPGVTTAVTLYISTGGLVYQVALRQIWSPQGLQQLVDELLHTIVPVIMIIYWAVYTDKTKVQWKQVPGWLIYPSVYLVYALTIGAFSGFYPYYFIDVAAAGYAKVIPNIIMLILLFVAVALVYVLLAKWMSKSKRTAPING